MHNPLPLYPNLKIDNYTTNLECFESFKATIYNKFCENMFMTDLTSRQFRHFFRKKFNGFCAHESIDRERDVYVLARGD
jgi:hypothetical protein